ncbi:MAG: cytochrome b/b6 domain-containing protein [Anaerolineae bacterium]|nr:cytochrome b/b6 domain-containing protein [Anaerolineae bacterium]
METERTYLRFPLNYRIEHWGMVLSFTMLAITGLVQKFAFSGVSIWIITGLGGIENVRIIHRIAATVLMVEAVYHIGLIGYNLIVRHYSADLMLSRTDLKNALQAFQYNLGLRNEQPLQGRYTFEEKFEYFAIIWGTIVMIVTGFVLWNPIAATTVLPGEFVPAAKAVHSGEALLAVLAIIVWHMYHVHIRKFNKSMITGRISEEDMREEHPLELATLQTAAEAEPDPNLARRRRNFLAIYGVVALALLVGIYVFVTFEQTALETVVPEETVVIYTQPNTQPEPIAVSFEMPMTSWENGVGQFFQTRCVFCHGSRIPLSGLDLTTYDTALLGGTSLAAIIPNDPENSGVILKFTNGDHPVLMTNDELERLSAWISAGAPQ